MPHPLDGARLKVVRAEQHLKTLNEEISCYLDTHPYEFPTEKKGDVAITKSAVIKREPPLELGCIAGDCLGNLRKSLDYIAWELATKYGSPTPVVGKTKGITFPIFEIPRKASATKSFADMAAKYAFPTAAISIIESVQQDHTGYEPLGVLNRLVNSDKHCVPLLTIAFAETFMIRVSTDNSVGQRDIVIHGIGTFSGFGEGATTIAKFFPNEEAADPGFDPVAELMAAHKAAGEAPPEQFPNGVKVDGQVTVFVSFEDPSVKREPIDTTLEQIIKCVANIVPMFDPLF